jgi:hypothetical protein
MKGELGVAYREKSKRGKRTRRRRHEFRLTHGKNVWLRPYAIGGALQAVMVCALAQEHSNPYQHIC